MANPVPMTIQFATQLFAVAIYATTAQAQITIDNTSVASGDTATLSFSHTVHPGLDSLLMVGVEVHAQTKVNSVQWGTSSTPCSSTCDPASCLCGLTRVGTVTNSGKNVTAQLWQLLNPPAGTGDVVITLPSAHRLVGGATSLHGVDQTTPLGAAATNSADTAAPATVEVSSTAGGIVLDALGTNPNATLTATGEEQTQEYQASASSGGTSSGWVTGAGSIAPGAASVTMSWNAPPVNWAIIAVSINAAPTPTGGPPSPTPSPTPSVASCVGDCWDSGSVSVDALLTLVEIALGEAEVSTCPAGDANDDMQITIDEILTAINNALAGCPGSPAATKPAALSRQGSGAHSTRDH